MPDLNSNDKLKTNQERANAETKRLEAETKLLVAEKNTFVAKKERAEAEMNAHLAAAQAAIGSIVGSKIEGAVTVQPGAGKGEATLLASRAIGEAATRIAEALGAGKVERVVLMQGAKAPQFASYRQFLLKQGLLERVFNKTKEEAERLENEAERLENEAERLEEEAEQLQVGINGFASPISAGGVLTAGGVAIDFVAKLGSYFMSNYEIGGIDLTSDAEQLANAVANRLLRQKIAVILPGRRIPQSSDLSDTFEKVVTLIAESGAKPASLSDQAEKATASAASLSDPAKKAALEQAAKLYGQAATLLRDAIKRAEESMKESINALEKDDTEGIMMMTKVVQEKIVCDELAKGDALALVLDVRALGGYYTKKNLWTFLGGMPFFAMGGAVITYSLVDKAGELKASGLVPVHSGYAAADKIPNLMIEQPSADKQ